MAISVYWLQRG